MVMKKYLIIALSLLLYSCGCGDEKQKGEDTSDDEVVLGNTEKVAFVEDFYEKYFDALGDRESLSNLMTDLVSERGVDVIKRAVGDSQDAFINIFKPSGLDSIADRTKLQVDVNQVNPDDDMLYDVKISYGKEPGSTIVLSVAGDNGSFQIDSISNPDYNQ